MRVFVDTSFYIACALPRDQWRQRAADAPHPGMSFVTSSLVINETAALLQRKHFSAALTFLHEVRANLELEIVHLDAGLQSEAWDLFSRWGAAGATPVDCASFAIMKRFSIRKAFTFDEHFQKAGFEILR
jgi:predicted nucleic acid-binding protein